MPRLIATDMRQSIAQGSALIRIHMWYLTHIIWFFIPLTVYIELHDLTLPFTLLFCHCLKYVWLVWGSICTCFSTKMYSTNNCNLKLCLYYSKISLLQKFWLLAYIVVNNSADIAVFHLINCVYRKCDCFIMQYITTQTLQPALLLSVMNHLGRVQRR